MSNIHCFCNLSPKAIADLIANAKQRVLYAAPSLTLEIASALAGRFETLKSQCQIILDYNEQLFRLGYGFNDAVDLLIEQKVPVRKQPNLRLGCLIVDDSGWAFAQLPMAVESQDSLEAINAIALGEDQILQICKALEAKGGDPHPIKNDHSDQPGSTGDPKDYPQVGISVTTLAAQEVKSVSQALKENPPQGFDLQRKVRVYQSHLQFVDVSLEGGRVQQRRIPLSKELKSVLFSAASKVEQRFNANYRLVDGATSSVLDEINKDLTELLDASAPSLGKRLGRVLLRSNRRHFDDELAKLRARLEAYRTSEKQKLQDAIEKSLSDLAETLAPMIRDRPPKYLQARCSEVTLDIARDYLLDQLRKSAPSADVLMKGLQLHCTYKDVTWEMLNDKEYQTRIRKKFPYAEWLKPFHEEIAAGSKRH